MKTIYKKSIHIALSTCICLFLAIPAIAQRPATGGGGGGGGSKPSGGGGSSSSVSARPSGSSSAASVRPSGGGGNGGFRPSGNAGVVRPSGAVVQRGGTGMRNPVYVDRQGNVLRNNGYAPRVGVNPQRGSYGYAPRAGLNGAANVPRGSTSGGINGYRSSPQVGSGHGGYWGNHGYNYHNRGYYNSYYAPRLGFSIGILPYGYYPFFWGDYQYYYSDGLYYQYDNNEYTVVEPPIGAEITTLPDKAQSIVINGQQYYELNGVYYQPVTKDDGTIVYQIAGKDGELNTTAVQDDQQQQGPKIGDIVVQLPADCRKISVNGQKLYVSPDGVYYQPQVDASGNTTYKIVGLPSDEPDQN